MKIYARNNTMSDLFKIISYKWTLLILYDLCHGTKRFGQLQESLQGISPRTLSERLEQLESFGIVTKKIYPQVPLRVEYTLTLRGRSLGEIIIQIKEWEESCND